MKAYDSLRLTTVPGIGPIIATCLSASVSDARLFEGGREFAAWLGLVPRQYSTGGKPRLGSISKMGNRHLRNLLVVGAHAALYRMRKAVRDTPLGSNEIVVSVANEGEPIPAHVRDHLFEPFFRATSSAEKQGLGLGLFISGEIARSHGGSLEVRSDENQTAFLFRMPV